MDERRGGRGARETLRRRRRLLPQCGSRSANTKATVAPEVAGRHSKQGNREHAGNTVRRVRRGTGRGEQRRGDSPAAERDARLRPAKAPSAGPGAYAEGRRRSCHSRWRGKDTLA